VGGSWYLGTLPSASTSKGDEGIGVPGLEPFCLTLCALLLLFSLFFWFFFLLLASSSLRSDRVSSSSA